MIRNLKKLRQNANMSQQQLADIIGVSQQSINKYENHSIEPDIETLSKIADYFCVSIDYLVGKSDRDFPESIKLSQDETSFIRDLRRLSSSEKESVLLIIKNYLSGK